MRNLFLNILLGLTLSTTIIGCNGIPAGDPPDEGVEIVNIPKNIKLFNRKTATNHMITSILITGVPFLTYKTKRPTFRLVMDSSDNNDDSLTMKIWGELIDERHILPMNGKQSFKADFVLRSQTTRSGRSNLKVWDLQILSADGKIIHWKESLLFR